MSKDNPLTPDDAEAVKIFINARGFQIAAIALDAQQGPARKLLFWPMVVNEVFALELFVKALLRLRGTVAKGHDINALFKKLGAVDKRRIDEFFHEIIQHHPAYQWGLENNISFDVESVLLRNRETFKNARYWHEGTPPSPDAEGKVSNAGTGTLSDAIWRLILQDYPSWADTNLSMAITMPESSRQFT
jgi:hypothetical protein